jgi:hypothetical protein
MRFYKRPDLKAPYFRRSIAASIHNGSGETMDEILAGLTLEDIRPCVHGALVYDFLVANILTERELQVRIRLHHSFFGRAFPDLYERNGTSLKASFRTQGDMRWHDSVAKPLHPEGRTRLHGALIHLNYAFAHFLLDLLFPAELALKDQNQQTPLHCFAMRRAETRDYLIEVNRGLAQRVVEADNGLAANTMDSGGNFPLHLVFDENSQLFPILLIHTKDLDAENLRGETVLELAVRRKSIQHVSQLIRTGRVDLSKTSRRDGQPLYSLIIQSGITEETIRELWLESGASLERLPIAEHNG